MILDDNENYIGKKPTFMSDALDVNVSIKDGKYVLSKCFNLNTSKEIEEILDFLETRRRFLLIKPVLNIVKANNRIQASIKELFAIWDNIFVFGNSPLDLTYKPGAYYSEKSIKKYYNLILEEKTKWDVEHSQDEDFDDLFVEDENGAIEFDPVCDDEDLSDDDIFEDDSLENDGLEDFDFDDLDDDDFI